MATLMSSSSDLSQILKSAEGSSRRGKIITVIIILLLLAGAFIGWRIYAKNREPKVTYVTEPLKRGDLKMVVTATGNLKPTNEVTVGSELSGTVVEVYVDTNDRVSKGQELARLDTSKLERQTESSRATAAAAAAKVEQARATLVEVNASLKRLQKLKESSGGRLPSQADMDTAIAAVERAKADLAAAQAEELQAKALVGANESDLQKSIIRSPVDGIVLTRNIEPGQTVAATMTAPELFVVAEKLENMKLEVAVAEADIGGVKEGQRATFTVDAWPDRSFEATVKKVEFGSSVTDNVVTYTTELEVTNDDLSLRPGMTATAEIAVAEARDVFLVPNAALRFNPSTATASPAAGNSAPKRSFVQSLVPTRPRRMMGSRGAGQDNADARMPRNKSGTIWVLQDGKPVEFKVKTGISDGNSTEVSGEGLKEDMPVIIFARQG